MSFTFLVYLIILTTGALLGLVFWKKLSLAFRLITSNLIWTALFESLSRMSSNIEETYFNYNLYAPVYFLIFTLSYWAVFRKNKLKWIPLIFGLVVVLNSVYSLLKYGMNIFSGSIILIDSLLLILCALLGFMMLLKDPKNRPLKVEPVFWLHTAMIFYWSFSFFRNSLFSEYHNMELLDLSVYENVHTAISTCFYAILGLSIYLNYRINNAPKQH